jgi:predicted MFS family arabinose efflux permease
MTLVFAAACGLAVANIYYAQPLIALIAPQLHLHAGLAGLIVALTQLGYGAGLLLLVPLADVVENRRLIGLTLSGVLLGLLAIAVSDSALTFLVASFVVGLCAVATQVLVPFASHLTPERSRGRVVGNVMGGLLAGIMLARPFSSYVAASLGWRAVFYISAAMMALLIVLLLRVLPQRRPPGRLSYAGTLASLPRLLMDNPLLRRRAFYQGMMFAAFNAFWTGSPLLLADRFGIGQKGIALFALAGAAGALVAPVAGRLADRGLTRPATGLALAAAIVAFILAAWAAQRQSLWLLVLAGVLLDGAVQLCQVLSLRSIYMLAPESRGRLNGLFMTSVFLCGASGSAVSAALYALAGWSALASMGALCAAAALVFYASEFRARVKTPLPG